MTPLCVHQKRDMLGDGAKEPFKGRQPAAWLLVRDTTVVGSLLEVTDVKPIKRGLDTTRRHATLQFPLPEGLKGLILTSSTVRQDTLPNTTFQGCVL